MACPQELKAVHNLCASIGSSLKPSQCQRSIIRYKNVATWFEMALAQIPSLSPLWEPTIVNLAHAYRKLSYMIDPTLKSFKNNKLDVSCKVIQECIHPELRNRPTIKDVTSKLREVIGICR